MPAVKLYCENSHYVNDGGSRGREQLACMSETTEKALMKVKHYFSTHVRLARLHALSERERGRGEVGERVGGRKGEGGESGGRRKEIGHQKEKERERKKGSGGGEGGGGVVEQASKRENFQCEHRRNLLGNGI